MRRVLRCAIVLVGAAGCGPRDPPENPTWVDVQPIVRAECSGCHGAGAADTGGGYRFDFYDMTDDPCGEAAKVLADVSLARALTDKIARAITTTDPDVRPAMPPLPAPYLTDDQWQTILRWTANPGKGDKPMNNRPPHITIDGTPTMVDERLDLNAIVSDPDGDPVVGVLKIGDRVNEKMDHAGAYAKSYDTSAWPAGAMVMNVVMCDGWSQVSVDLVQLIVRH